MKKLIVLVDMDDTIENLLDAWVAYLNNSHGTNVNSNDIAQWDISKSFPSLSKQQVYEPIFNNEFWKDVKPIEGACEALQRLMKDGHKVLIVTSSAYETLPAKMTDVLFKYFPFIEWKDVIITSHKQLIKGDVLIDDGVHNLEGGDYLRLLMNAPHNRTYDAKANGMHRVYNWAEAYDIITSYAETLNNIEKEGGIAV